MGGVGQRPGVGFSDSESAVRRLPACRVARGAPRRRGHRRPDRRPRRLRAVQAAARATSPSRPGVPAAEPERAHGVGTRRVTQAAAVAERVAARGHPRVRRTARARDGGAGADARAPGSARRRSATTPDFYASIEHATNVGSMFRPDNPLLPNYKWVPIGYHGRSSSIVLSGANVVRPVGQTRDGSEGAPVFGPSAAAGLRGTEVGVFIRIGQRVGNSDPDRRRRGARVRSLSAQRLVGPRHPGVGVPAARTLSRQEFCDDGVAVGRDARRPRAFPRAGLSSRRGRPGTLAISFIAAMIPMSWRHRHHPRPVPARVPRCATPA